MAFTPNKIEAQGRTYILHTPLNCIIHKERDHFVIENEAIDVYAAGETELHAEQNFYEEFSIRYVRLNELQDDQLSGRLNRAKIALSNIVKEIIPA